MAQEQHLDALVVGAGLTGIYALHSLLGEGLTVQAVEKANEVGGTWYANKYPGALSDTWSYVYRYSFDKELLQNYPAARWYSTQPEILDYLKHVVEKHDLRKHIQFNTEMMAAHWDDDAKRWKVQCQTGDVFHVRYLITAPGLLVKPNMPAIPGFDTFQGQIGHTATWDSSIQLENKRVGVVGVGSSGVQVVTAIASKVKSLHVFIRRPQYSVPTNDRPITPEEREAINKQYPEIWNDVNSSVLGMGFPEPARSFMSVEPQEREKIMEGIWKTGNALQLMFGAFSDIAVDKAANEEVCRFLRKKIAGIVKDPQKLDVLTPKEPFARRPLSDGGYFKQFNRENVHAIDVMKHPITEVTPGGMRTADGKLHELDVIIIATGFQAIDGSYAQMEIRGRQKSDNLRDLWKRVGLRAYMGCSVSGYPNLLMALGPMVAFSNIPPLAQTHVDFLRVLIRRAEEISKQTGRQCEIEATEQAEQDWAEVCDKAAGMTLFPQTSSWLFKTDVPGKEKATLFYLRGLGRFRATLDEIKAQGFTGFKGPFGPSEEQRARL
ncbi:cyclohexanone monooxygenase [Aspergillus ellipticus CBS 707.79]|uniref:Cyclohexanone monooxygenase n=1 Tax=Aspergillus ellipticus CBS 707.79 TaxID=1448320 RepID=A0A319EWS8_9EURO|nr:cyclohexanone monooxygenase [Aspergillus ellipticus CBS 707.79]PYH96082.1 cyclohexanone monooxygenase [Aspergillus ellipticus CBS 707.79]